MTQRKNPKGHSKKEELHAEQEVSEEELLPPQETGGRNEEEERSKREEEQPVEEIEGKTSALESKNGKKTERGGGQEGSKRPVLTWFLVLALLGVWSSMAVVYFDIVDYDSVIARAQAFHMNFSDVLQGKLVTYDADGDGDFDMEDAKVLLDENTLGGSSLRADGLRKGIKGAEPARSPEKNTEHLGEASSNQGPGSRGAEPIEATSPALPVEDGSPGVQDLEAEIQDQDFVPDDPQSSLRPHEDPAEGIDRTGALVEEPSVEDSEVDSGQYLTSSKFTQEAAETRAEPPESKSEREAEPGSHGTTDRQAEEKPKEKAPAKAKKPKLLNKFDKTIKAEIDAAEKLRKKGKLEEALRAFDALVQLHPQSPRARYGKAQAEDGLAEKLRSNDMLQKAISTYREAAELPDATADLLRAALKRRAERQQFLGRIRGALATLEKLTQVFPDDIGLKNDLGVAHLLLGDNKGAKRVYEEVLAVAPTDGFAKVHYGFILKSENRIAESIPYLKEGLESGEPGTDDGRFYFHLGDALQRVGDESAYHWYEVGHKHGHFASVWQRSLYNVNGLKAQPWWTPKETGYTDLVKALERNWKTIRDEALAGMDQKSGLFIPEEENLREKGEWGQYTLWQQGKKLATSCQSVPKTCSLLERFPEATGCKRGQIKFSVMQPGTHVWPHTGPTNCRLRMHLGLVIPQHGCRIRCTDQTREWQEGKVLIFDDSFEHEVWQEADSYRLIFIVDVWHPELTASQRQGLSPI